MTVVHFSFQFINRHILYDNQYLKNDINIKDMTHNDILYMSHVKVFLE